MSNYHLSDTSFASLSLSADLQLGIQEAGYEFCTPIQALTLPIALAGKDVSGQAQTGTGKTAAFLVATLETLNKNDATTTDEGSEKAEKNKKTEIRSLIIAPTRELAKQIFEDAKPLNINLNYKLALAYGGTDYEKQRTVLEKGCDILIGTPGRIIDYFKQGVFELKQLEVLIMDEADRMFDMGFISDIRYLLRAMPSPENRQSLLFSATMSERVKELAYEHMNSPETVVVEAEQVTADKIEQSAFMPANEEKIPLSLGLLRQNSDGKSIIFINTKHQGEKLQAWLETNEFKSGLLSGDVPQKKRERLLQQFKNDTISTLVATDVAARGLHIEGVDMVINFDLPNDAEDYVHRIGRTARAGASGKAISLVCETYGMNIVDIESYIENKIPMIKEHSEFLAKDLIIPKKTERTKRPIRNNKPKDSKTTQNILQRKPQVSNQLQTNETTVEADTNSKNRQRYMRRSKISFEVPLIG